MKKRILLSLSPFLFGAIAVQAQASSEATPAATIAVAKTATDEKTPVKKEDLPEAVKKALTSEAYAGWEISEAFWIKTESAAYYEINLKKEDKITTVKLNTEGNKVD